MKKLLTIIMLLTCFNTYSQYTVDNTYLSVNMYTTTISSNINLRLSAPPSYKSDSRIGPYLTLGGITFVAIGLMTPSTYVGGSTTQKKPFMQQPKCWPIIAGGILSTVGLVITISGN